MCHPNCVKVNQRKLGHFFLFIVYQKKKKQITK